MSSSYLYLSTLRDFLRLKRVLTWLAVSLGLVLMGVLIKRVSVDRPVDELYSLLSSTLVFRLFPSPYPPTPPMDSTAQTPTPRALPRASAPPHTRPS